MTKPLMINILCNKTHIKPHIQLSLVNLAWRISAPHLSHQANFHCLEQGWKATKGKMHQTTQQWIPETNQEKKTIIFESLVFVFFRSAICSFLPEDLLDWKGFGFWSWNGFFGKLLKNLLTCNWEGKFFPKFLKLTTIFGSETFCCFQATECQRSSQASLLLQ